MKVLSVFKYVFLSIGLAILLGSWMAYKSSRDFLEKAVSTQGTVVDFVKVRGSSSTTFRPVVQFITGQGQEVEFISSTGRSRPSFTVGQQVDILYLPENPEDAKFNNYSDLWSIALVTGVMGGVFFSVGAIIFLVGGLKSRRKEYLLRSGVSVEAEFRAVECNEGVSLNGRNPFVIVCHWLNPSTSELHVFESENIWFDPSAYIKSERVKVFIDRANPRKYHVDLSFLPRVAS